MILDRLRAGSPISIHFSLPAGDGSLLGHELIKKLLTYSVPSYTALLTIASFPVFLKKSLPIPLYISLPGLIAVSSRYLATALSELMSLS